MVAPKGPVLVSRDARSLQLCETTCWPQGPEIWPERARPGRAFLHRIRSNCRNCGSVIEADAAPESLEAETTSASPAKRQRLNHLLGATQLKPQCLEPTRPARYPSISLSSVSSRSRHSAARGMHPRAPKSATLLPERTTIQRWQGWSSEPTPIFYFVSLDVLSPLFLLVCAVHSHTFVPHPGSRRISKRPC